MKRFIALCSLLLTTSAFAVDPAFENCVSSTPCTDATTCEITAPAHDDGDLLVFMGGAYDRGNQLDPADTLSINEAGWTSRTTNACAEETGTNRYCLVSTKIAAAEAGTYTFEATGVDATIEFDGTMCNIPGENVDAANPMDGTVTYATAADTTAYDAASITAGTDGALIVVLVVAANSGGACAVPTGYAETFETTVVETQTHRTCVETKTLATAGPEDPAAATGLGANADWDTATLAFKPAAGTGVYDTAPTVASQTATAYTATGSLDAAGNADAAACPKDQAPPSIAQVTAGNCTGDVAALATDTDAPAGAPFDFTSVLTLSNGFPIADLYITDRTTLTTLADEVLDVPAGETRCVLTSVAGTSPYASVDVVSGDYIEIASLTTPDGYATFCEVDGTVGYVAGGDTSRQLVDSDIYDVSGEDVDEYLLVFNNQAPILTSGEWPLDNSLNSLGVDPAFASEAEVSDPEADDMTWTVQAGALPTNWVLAAGDGALSGGAPGACGNYDFTLRTTDIYSDFLDLVGHVDIGNAVPDVADVAEATAVSTIEALCSLTTTTRSACSASIASGNVIATSPVIGTVVLPDAAVTLLVSTGPTCGSRRRQAQ